MLKELHEARYTDGDKQYKCICACGNFMLRRAYVLKHYHESDCSLCTIKKRKKHGMSYTSLYKLWARLKDRCGKDKGYEHITYPAKWKQFEGFIDDMITTYFDGATIDRINNDLSYSKSNCQWLTQSEHASKSAKERWDKCSNSK